MSIIQSINNEGYFSSIARGKSLVNYPFVKASATKARSIGAQGCDADCKQPFTYHRYWHALRCCSLQPAFQGDRIIRRPEMQSEQKIARRRARQIAIPSITRRKCSRACRKSPIICAKMSRSTAKAMFETFAEVLDGLIQAFQHYEQKGESAWRI
jgi:hypothetical protein